MALDRTIKVRVKTKTADSKIFRWNRRKDNGKAFRTPPGGRFGADDFCVLVDLAGATPEYFVRPTESVEHKIQEHRRNSPMLTIDRPRNDAGYSTSRTTGLRSKKVSHDRHTISPFLYMRAQFPGC